MSGVFVTLEGPEGAGKSTVIQSLAGKLAERGLPYLVTREPGDGPVGSRIRQILLEGDALTPLAEVFLFLADRAQHVETVIRPALREGKIVLCDRYGDSFLVYQGYGRQLDIEALRSWNEDATGHLKPDLTMLLDLDPEIGLKRHTKGDRLDLEPLPFHQRVRAGFLAESGRERDRWTIIDASKSREEVVEKSWQELCRAAGITNF